MGSLRRRRRTLSRVVAILAITIVAAGAVVIRVAARPSPQQVSWPAMELSYQEEGHFSGLSRPTSTKAWRLSYQNRLNWTKELVADSADASAVGLVYRYTGGAFTVDDPVTASTLAPAADPGGSAVVPDWWLVPMRQASLEERGYAKVVEPDEPLTRYVTSATVACVPDEDGMTTGISQPASCATDATYATRETVSYRTDVVPPIPVEVVDEMNGVVVSRIVVTKLTIDMGGSSVPLIP